MIADEGEVATTGVTSIMKLPVAHRGGVVVCWMEEASAVGGGTGEIGLEPTRAYKKRAQKANPSID